MGKNLQALEEIWQELQRRIEEHFDKMPTNWSWNHKEIKGETFIAEISNMNDQVCECGRMIRLKFRAVHDYDCSYEEGQIRNEVFLFFRLNQVVKENMFPNREWDESQRKWIYPLRMFKTPSVNKARTIFVNRLEWEHIKAQVAIFLLQIHNQLFAMGSSINPRQIQTVNSVGIVRKNSKSRKSENMCALLLKKEEIDQLWGWIYEKYLPFLFKKSYQDDLRSELIDALLKGWTGGQRWRCWTSYIGSTVRNIRKRKTEKTRYEYGIPGLSSEKILISMNKKTASDGKDNGRTCKALAKRWGCAESTIRRWCRRGYLELDPNNGEKIPEMYTQESVNYYDQIVNKKKERKKRLNQMEKEGIKKEAAKKRLQREHNRARKN